MPFPVRSRIGMPAFLNSAICSALSGVGPFASVSTRTRTGTPDCHRLINSFVYRGSSMNQNAASIPAVSFRMRLSSIARQSS
jgi:hypothetical protein